MIKKFLGILFLLLSVPIHGIYVGGNALWVTSKNVGIGTTTPAYRLDVSGTANISSGLIVDTNTLYVNASTNKVGIGTSSPGAKLGVYGDIILGTGAANANITWDGTQNWDLNLTNSSDLFEIRRNTTSVLSINTSSEVSIGGSAISGYGLSVLGARGLYVTDDSGSNGLMVKRGNTLFLQLTSDTDKSFIKFGAVTLNMTQNGINKITLDPTGNTTIQQTLTISAQPTCIVYNSGTIGSLSPSGKVVSWNSETYDVAAMHSTTSLTSRITVTAPNTHTYLTKVQVNISSGGGFIGDYYAEILKNGSTVLARARSSLGGKDSCYINFTSMDRLTIGDYLTVKVYDLDSDAGIIAIGSSFSTVQLN